MLKLSVPQFEFCASQHLNTFIKWDTVVILGVCLVEESSPLFHLVDTQYNLITTYRSEVKFTMNKSIDGSKTCCTFLREAFAFLRERINYQTVVSELWSKMKLLVKISWLYMPVYTDRTGALLQIGSSSRDSVPVPFHLLPGKCSLTPDECLLFMQ